MSNTMLFIYVKGGLNKDKYIQYNLNIFCEKNWSHLILFSKIRIANYQGLQTVSSSVTLSVFLLALFFYYVLF